MELHFTFNKLHCSLKGVFTGFWQSIVMWPLPKSRYRISLLPQKAPCAALLSIPSPKNSSFHNDHSVSCTQRFFFPSMSFKCNHAACTLLGPTSSAYHMCLRLIDVACSKDLILLLWAKIIWSFLKMQSNFYILIWL